MKGLGGYHLACDARNEAAVAELRRASTATRSRSPSWCGTLRGRGPLRGAARPNVRFSSRPAAPIVLLRKRSAAIVAEEVAPRNPFLGVMLPYTPLHHLLLDAVDGMPLVMTSGNRSDEPIAYRTTTRPSKLAGIADLFLTHDRPIHVRCDDSVTRIVDGVELPLRRSRGYAPQPIALPR